MEILTFSTPLKLERKKKKKKRKREGQGRRGGRRRRRRRRRWTLRPRFSFILHSLQNPPFSFSYSFTYYYSSNSFSHFEKGVTHCSYGEQLRHSGEAKKGEEAAEEGGGGGQEARRAQGTHGPGHWAAL